MRIEDSDLAREVNDTSGHPLRKSPHETLAEYQARVDEFMAVAGPRIAELIRTRADDDGETRAFDTQGETR